MNPPAPRMVISSLWCQVAMLTFLVGFAVLGYLAYRIYAEQPPVPRQVVREDGTPLFTGDDILAGQHIFQ
jgi:nitric oxide reductase subunit B